MIKYRKSDAAVTIPLDPSHNCGDLTSGTSHESAKLQLWVGTWCRATNLRHCNNCNTFPTPGGPHCRSQIRRWHLDSPHPDMNVLGVCTERRVGRSLSFLLAFSRAYPCSQFSHIEVRNGHTWCAHVRTTFLARTGPHMAMLDADCIKVGRGYSVVETSSGTSSRTSSRPIPTSGAGQCLAQLGQLQQQLCPNFFAGNTGMSPKAQQTLKATEAHRCSRHMWVRSSRGQKQINLRAPYSSEHHAQPRTSQCGGRNSHKRTRTAHPRRTRLRLGDYGTRTRRRALCCGYVNGADLVFRAYAGVLVHVCMLCACHDVRRRTVEQ